MNSLKIKVRLLTLLLAFLSYNSFSQLTVNPNQTATVLATTLAGPGVTVLAPTLTCPGVANGLFTSTGTLLTMNSGILLTCGHAAAAVGPYGPPPGTASFNDGAPGDPSLTAILGGSTTYDACVLQFDVVAKGDSIGFNYQFGSQEYYSAVCSQYNDLFAFFISGPGIVGAPNMALIPGTNIPVEINTVNNGIPGSSGGVLSNCTSVGAGSPFTTYYLDNTGGTLLSYKGFTKKFRAAHQVTPCDTYHLKLAIADAGNAIYDSGVFLEGASLTTNNFTFNHADSIGATIGGVPHTIVKGCAATPITILSSHLLPANETLHFTFGGTAVHGVDFTSPDSVTMLSGTDSIAISISGIPTPPGGTKTLELYLTSPTTCGVLDSVTINILDSPSANILTPDTTICLGATFQIRVAGSTGLSYLWSPATSLSSPVVIQPLASPSVTTTYTMTATLPGAGCPAITGHVAVTVINTAITIVTPPASICAGGSVPIVVSGAPGLSYNWSPATGLNNATIQNPVATPTATTTYTVTASTPGGACSSTASITITVAALTVAVLTPDTSVCLGTAFTIQATGPAGPNYTWTPTAGLSTSTILNPLVTPTATTSYSLNATWPGSGCPDYNHTVNVTVYDPTMNLLTPDTSICSGNIVYLRVNGASTLNYTWTPQSGLNDPYIADPVATPTVTTTYTVTGVTPGGLCKSVAALTISVGNPVVNVSANDTTICIGTAIYMPVTGGTDMSYTWIPATGLTNPGIMSPLASPQATTVYTLVVTAPGFPCIDSEFIRVNVIYPLLTNVTADATIAYGSSIQLNCDNSMIYMWTPDDGSLNNNNINNPVATPKAPTTYVVTALDQHGCLATDSVKIDVTYDNIFIPDAFTPNNDGLNDFFRVGNLGFYKLVSMGVYNRWGQEIYHAVDGNNKGWDGTFYGTPQNMDVYNYLIILAQPDGVQKSFKGNVTLIR